MKTIYNTYIKVTSKQQADRLKKMCLDNNLPIWDDEASFELRQNENWFEYYKDDKEFLITVSNVIGFTEFGKTKVSEDEFLKLIP